MDAFTKLFSVAVIGYIASVVFVNLGFSFVPMIATPIGMLSPMAVIVGFVFVIRDYAQRRAGHWVLLAMIIATGLSYLLADPFVATASAIAFATSEIADYLLYTFTKKPFHQRVVYSSLISAPIDTAVFLLGINGFTIGTFVLMVLSKLIAAGVIWWVYRSGAAAEPAVDENGEAMPATIANPYTRF